MARVTNKICSQYLVRGLIVGVMTTCGVGCDSGTPKTPTPAPSDAPAARPVGKGKAEVIGGETFDLGTAEGGQKIDHVFEIKNVGTDTLTLKKEDVSCGKCITTFEIDKLVLKPTEIAKATVKGIIPPENPEFRQYAPFSTDNPTQPTVKMYLVGKVVKRVVLEPNPWIIGEVLEGQPKEFTATLTSAISDKLEVKSIQTGNPQLKVTASPMPAEKLAELKVKAGYYLKAVLEANIPAGDFKDQVSLKLATPDSLDLIADATAHRSGPLQIFGPGWHAERMQLALAAFDPKEPLVTRLFLNTRGIEDELKIVKLECPDDRFSFELKPDLKFQGAKGDYRRYEFFVQVAPSNRSAIYTALTPLKVDITTNQEQIKQFQLKITCQALVN